ncbi:MAG: hypothetical protein R2838_21715 [Caldilineaceae bacterium]
MTEAGDAAGHGFDLHLRTLDGTVGVTLQIRWTSRPAASGRRRPPGR